MISVDYKNKVAVAAAFIISIQQKHAGIQVKILTRRDACIPAKADSDLLDARRLFAQEMLPPLEREIAI